MILSSKLNVILFNYFVIMNQTILFKETSFGI